MTRSPRRRVLTALVVAAAIGALVPGCRHAAKVEGAGRLDPSGRVLLTRDDEQTTVVSSRTLATGDTVEVGDGTAKISHPGGDAVELRTGSVLVLGRDLELRNGSLLTVTAGGSTRTVRAAGSQVDATGAARIDATIALRIVAYQGRAVVRSGGRSLPILALREASVPVVGVIWPRPLAVDPADGWDQRFLGDAAAKQADLESLARGFTGQVSPANATSAGYYRTLLPGLSGEAGFQQADVERLGGSATDGAGRTGAERFRAGDVLLGAAIALQGRRGTFAERLAGATAFRAAGASWALVSLDQQVPSISDLLRFVDGAVNVAPLELAAPAPRPAAAAPEPAPAQAPVVTAAPRTPSTRAPTTTRPSRTTSTTAYRPPQQAQPQPQSPAPIVLPVDPLLDAAVDPVVKLLNDLLGNR